MQQPSPVPQTSSPEEQLRLQYLALLKRVLTRQIGGERQRRYDPVRPFVRMAARPVQAVLDRMGLEVVHHLSPEIRAGGADWPAEAETMIGDRRMDNIQNCVTTVLRDDVAGDLVECGVWRGGAAIFMKAILFAYGDEDRLVWAADSFKGLPQPDERHAADAGDLHHTFEALEVSVEEVRANFAKYGLLDDRVRFLEGWFSDTLPTAPIERVAVLRLDGDMYGSTMDALTALYEKVSPGGFVIIDDYVLDPCRQAVTEFRDAHGIADVIERIDHYGAYWRRS